jgi:hypothetical protein
MPQSEAQYFFGNSLVFFTGDSAYSNVPIWMDLFAETAGHHYAVAGSFGFLRNFADQDPPFSQWGFAGVDGAWDPDVTSFADASFDRFFITPANFIQDVSPDSTYIGDTRSPLDAVLDIVGGVVTDHPTAQILIYEGWADMGPYAAELPIAASALGAYYTYSQGIYHDWYLSLVEDVNTANPAANLALLPVATILADILTGPLSTVPTEALYVDTAPHGTDTVYFLAAMITYQATYGEQVPLPTSLPGDLHPTVLSAFATINALIETELESAGFVIGDPPVTPVQLPDGYGVYDARYFVLEPGVTDLGAVDFSGPANAQANNMQPDFLYEAGALWDGGPLDNFAIQFTRTIDAGEGGVYVLRLTTDELAEVYIDGTRVLETLSAPPEETQEIELSLASGTHVIDIRYMDTIQEASLQVDWDYLRPLPITAARSASVAQAEAAQQDLHPKTTDVIATSYADAHPDISGIDARILVILGASRSAFDTVHDPESFDFADVPMLQDSVLDLLF